jgi:zinc protease
MSSPLRSLPVAVAAVALAACGPPMINFGGLPTDARSLKISNNLRLLELSNGMRVALVPDTRTNLVSVDVRYLAGGNQDPAGRAGLAHLLEHLTFTMPG